MALSVGLGERNAIAHVWSKSGQRQVLLNCNLGGCLNAGNDATSSLARSDWERGDRDLNTLRRAGQICKILGLSGKPEGIDGSRVEEMVLTGQIEEVARYCESDVLNTYRVWLVYELFRGSISVKELDWSEMQVQNFVATRKTANSQLCAAVGIEASTYPDVGDGRPT